MKVLLIEDEHKIANSIKKGLEAESCVVDISYDGKQGFEMAVSTMYDIIVLDLMLPSMDGLTICNNLRAMKNHTPILMLTAKSQTQERVVGLNTGADDYLPKPFAFDELLARIKAITRRPSKTLTNNLTVDSLSLNTQTYEVKRSDKVLTLSKREFSLLEYLMRHANTVVSKQQIIESVWEYDTNILPNTVEVYIGYLRKKIDQDPKEKPLIHTVRGFGYKLGV